MLAFFRRPICGLSSWAAGNSCRVFVVFPGARKVGWSARQASVRGFWKPFCSPEERITGTDMRGESPGFGGSRQPASPRWLAERHSTGTGKINFQREIRKPALAPASRNSSRSPASVSIWRGGAQSKSAGDTRSPNNRIAWAELSLIDDHMVPWAFGNSRHAWTARARQDA